MKICKRSAASALVTAGLALITLPASAAQVTWYFTGHFQADPSAPADLLALFPAGGAFNASFTFDSAIASNPLYQSADRTDFVTQAAAGVGTTLDLAGHHFETSNATRIIEQATFNGQTVTLNGGAMSSPLFPSNYQFVALDVANFGHFGLGSASTADKYPWFSPFGSGGAFKLLSSTVLPDLSKSDNPATLDVFAFDSVTQNYVHRMATIEGIQTTPFAALQPVPEPESWALMAAGLAVLGFVARRKQQGPQRTASV